MVNYLVHFKPGKRIAEIVSQQKELVLPGSGLHCTLCFLDMEPKKEAEFVRQLAQLKFHPFEVNTTQLDLFDGSSLVLRLTKPDELARIHQEVVYLSRWYANKKSGFHETKSKYYLGNYTPHITISKQGSLKDKSDYFLKPLIGLEFMVDEFYLSKKDAAWQEVARFPALSYSMDLLDLKSKLFKHFSVKGR